MNPEYILRTQSNFANTYGVGEVVLPGITLFRAGNYDIDLDRAESILAVKRKQTNGEPN